MGNTDIFEMMASGYDTPERVQIAKVISEAIRKQLVNSTSKKAIDFGCGTGLVGLNLINDFDSILFVDTAQNMLDQIKQKMIELKIENVDTLCFDFEKDHLLDLKADYIFMSQVLLHIKDVKPVLSRLYDVLDTGGHLIIVDFDKNDNVVSDMVHNGFNQNELRDMMTDIGFGNVQSETFYQGSNIFMNQDASMFLLNAEK